MTGLRLLVIGAAEVKWTEGGSRSSVTYQGEQIFMKAVNYFFGKEDGEVVEVRSGIHLYKFQCIIPKNSPGSIEGKYGSIRYHADVKLDIPYLPDMVAKQTFTVVRQEDLSRHPELLMTSEVEEVKTFCCFVCESDPLMLRVTIKKSGYMLGEEICVDVKIYNKSNMKFSKSLITLNRVETFKSYSPMEKSKKYVKVVAAVFSKGVEPKRDVSFQENLQIPNDIPISNDHISDVLQISYEVKVFLKAYKESSTIEAFLPICIGTIGCRTNSTPSIDSASLPVEDTRTIFFKF